MHVPASKAESELLFDIIRTVSERQSVILTGIVPFENWTTEVLGNERLKGATLDRLTHRCHILQTKGESYRLKDAQQCHRTTERKQSREAQAGRPGVIPAAKSALHNSGA